MDIAHHQLALNTRRGAAFGFAGIAKLAGADLSAHVGALVPKLYRCAGGAAAACWHLCRGWLRSLRPCVAELWRAGGVLLRAVRPRAYKAHAQLSHPAATPLHHPPP